VPSYSLRVVAVETNKVPTMPVRGAGYSLGTFAIERLLDFATDESPSPLNPLGVKGAGECVVIPAAPRSSVRSSMPSMRSSFESSRRRREPIVARSSA
jgi:CO/xanthine dehydrogenase Mo-binding subunit